jgi:dipeptidase E
VSAPTILALGGGGLTAVPGDPALDELALDLAGRPDPRVLLLPTASGDAGDQIARFHGAFGARPVRRTVISLFRLRDLHAPLREIVLGQDVIYVGGGSMRNLLALWREHDLDLLLAEVWQAGIVLAGPSAGAMCWCAGGVTRSAGPPQVAAGLGLLPFSLSVHRDSEPERLPAYREAVAAGRLPAGWAVDDGAALVVRGAEVERVVSARPQAGAARVAARAGQAVVTEAEVERLPTVRGARGAGDPALDEWRAVRARERGRLP